MIGQISTLSRNSGKRKQSLPIVGQIYKFMSEASSFFPCSNSSSSNNLNAKETCNTANYRKPSKCNKTDKTNSTITHPTRSKSVPWRECLTFLKINQPTSRDLEITQPTGVFEHGSKNKAKHYERREVFSDSKWKKRVIVGRSRKMKGEW